MEPNDLLIHIGYHRTGTTWLQSLLFDNAEAGFSSPWRYKDVSERLALVNELDFDPKMAQAYFEPGTEAARERGLVPVISAERLSGNPNSGGYDSKTIADRLAAAFPGGRILIVIREQKNVIHSVYKLYIWGGGVTSIGRYLDPPKTGRGRVPLFDFRHYEYDRLIRYYQRVFGKERVLVLPYERLREDAAGYLEAITAFAGTKPPERVEREARNAALSGLSVGLKRRLNLFLIRDQTNPVGLFENRRVRRGLHKGFRRLDRVAPAWMKDPFDRRLKARVAQAVGSRYRESNRATGELAGIDLQRYGYEL